MTRDREQHAPRLAGNRPCVALASVDVARIALARVRSSAAKAYLRVPEVLLI
jgi:hypothetical protein